MSTDTMTSPVLITAPSSRRGQPRPRTLAAVRQLFGQALKLAIHPHP
jgi:hypothetical protein